VLIYDFDALIYDINYVIYMKNLGLYAINQDFSTGMSSHKAWTCR